MKAWKMKSKDLLRAVTGQGVMAAVGLLFFGNIWPATVFSFSGYLFPAILRKRDKRREENRMLLEFRDLLQSVSSSLAAGQSVENAFLHAVPDLERMHPGKASPMKRGLKQIIAEMELNIPIRRSIQDFAQGTTLEDIRDFADVFSVCRQTGADLSQVVSHTCEAIRARLDMSVEISVNTARQRFSQRVLGIMPFGMTGILMLIWPEYMEPLHQPLGNLVVALVLAMLGGAFMLGERIADIQI
ncbi:MAG TPA: hypothetical protein DD727_09600 [Clostridiales bacterium]|nr:hypothetical protein [Clostridiales bacterium]